MMRAVASAFINHPLGAWAQRLCAPMPPELRRVLRRDRIVIPAPLPEPMTRQVARALARRIASDKMTAHVRLNGTEGTTRRERRGIARRVAREAFRKRVMP